MEIEMIINTVFAEWIHICTIFGVFSFAAGIIYFSIAFLIKALINLECKIRAEKVLREAIKLYKKKRREEKAIKADIKDCIWNEESIESEDNHD